MDLGIGIKEEWMIRLNGRMGDWKNGLGDWVNDGQVIGLMEEWVIGSMKWEEKSLYPIVQFPTLQDIYIHVYTAHRSNFYTILLLEVV